MKKNFFLWSLLVVAVMSICSCSSKSDKMLSLVPADMDFVFVGDVKTIVESAGGSITDSKLTIPKWFSELAGSDADEMKDDANEFLKKSGVNTDYCVIAGNFNWSEPLFIAKLDDKKQFVKFIDDEGFYEQDSEDGAVVYKKKISDWNDSYILVKDSYVFFIDRVWNESDFNFKKAVTRMIDDAKESPFSKTKMADYIREGNAMGFSVKMPRELRQELRGSGMPSYVLEMYNGYVCVKSSVDADDVVAELKMFDDEGNPRSMKDFGDFMDLDAKVNSKALKFMGKDDSIVLASSLKDVKWSKYFEMIDDIAHMSRSDKQIFGMIEDYIKNIDGTLAIGFGLTNGLQSVHAIDRGRDVFNQISFTAVVEVKKDKISKLMKDIESLMDEARMPYEGSASRGFSLEFPDGSGSLYLAAEDNFLVFSNHRIQKTGDNITVKSFDFDDYIMAGACYLDKNNRLMKDLGIKSDLKCTYSYDAKDLEMKMKIEVKDGKGKGVIEKIGNILLEASQTNFSAYKSSYNDYDDDGFGYGEPTEQEAFTSDYYDYYGDSAVVEEATEYYEW